MPTAEDRERDEALAEIADRIVHIARRLSALPQQDSELAALSQLEALVLRYVDRHPGISPSQLAAKLELRSSNASTVLRSLVERGLLDRQPDPADRRGARFALTASAHESVQRHRAGWSSALRAVPLDAAAPQTLLDLLGEIERVLDEPDGD